MTADAEQDPGWQEHFSGKGSAEYLRLRDCEQSFDQITIGNLERLGVGSGHRCLEAGAGAGSIARWFAQRAGAANVVATDLDPRFLEEVGSLGVTVARQNLESDEPPATDFDFIHTRNVLIHLRDREAVLARMAGWLRPGGWLLVEEGLWQPRLSPYPVAARVVGALVDFITAAVGSDFIWAGMLPLPLERAGLTETGSLGYLIAQRPDSSAGVMLRRTVEQMAGPMLAAGLVDDADLAAYHELVRDPDYVDYNGGALITAWGRRTG
jgi:SAM-dependent methyltransferase